MSKHTKGKKNIEAKTHLNMYWEATKNNNISLALLIERKYDLDGYPPFIVTTALNALAEGQDMDKAIDNALGL